MKFCSYCGGKNDDASALCSECGTPFTSETPGKFADVWYWTPKSPFGLAFTTGLAALLICTGIYYTTGRAMGDFVKMYHPVDAGMPANYHEIGLFIHLAITLTVFSLGTLTFTFFVCYNRCQTELQGIITTVVTLCIIALLTLVPVLMQSMSFFMMVVPVVMIGMSVGLSAGYYVVGALQIFVGAWLLGWFGKRKSAKT